jgi:hypothetical protein
MYHVFRCIFSFDVPVYRCPSEAKKRIIRSVDVFYPTVIIDDVSVKQYPSVSDFLFSGISFLGRAPVLKVQSLP